jgi:hypothetical protein
LDNTINATASGVTDEGGGDIVTQIGAADDVNRNKTELDFPDGVEREEFREYCRLRSPDVKFTVEGQRTRRCSLEDAAPDLPPMLRLAKFAVELRKFAALTW